MPGRKHYSSSVKAAVFELRRDAPDMTQRDIAKHVGASEHAVGRWLKSVSPDEHRLAVHNATQAPASVVALPVARRRPVGGGVFDGISINLEKAGCGKRADHFAASVLAGREPACPLVRLMVERHVDDRKRTDVLWDADAAARACGFIEQNIQLVKGTRWAGKPFELFPWQAFIVESMFGWRRAGDGENRFDRLLLVHPKTSAKTPLAAAMVAYRVFMFGGTGVEGYVAAGTFQQAGIGFETMRDQIRSIDGVLTDGTRANVRMFGGSRLTEIRDVIRNNAVKRMSNPSKGWGVSGYTITALFVDELHEVQDATAMQKLLFGTKDELNPLVILSSNTGTTRSSAIGQWWDRGKTTLHDPCAENDNLLPMLCSADPEADLDDPAVWRTANPSMAYGLPGEATLRRDLLGNKSVPVLYAEAKRLNLGIWPDDTESAWLTRRALERTMVDNLDDTEGLKFVIALDLSSRRDLTSAAVVFLDQPLQAEVLSWTPAANILPWTTEYSSRWDEWARDGHVRAVPGEDVSFDFVVRELRPYLDNPGCCALVFDPWKMPEFLRAVERAGVQFVREKPNQRADILNAGIPYVIEHAQGYARTKSSTLGLWMHTSIDDISVAVLERGIRIARNPVLLHAMTSVVVGRDASMNQRFIKNKAMFGAKDDPAVALTMAVGAARALLRDARPRLSFDEMFGMSA